MRVVTYERGGKQTVRIVERGSLLGIARAWPDQATNTLATVAGLISEGGATRESGDVGCGIDEKGSRRRRIAEIRN
jgi:hypothetical protein